jgi:hypothetical protein
MKNSDEMVSSLLMRREQYIIEQKRKRKVIMKTVTTACCMCVVVLIGIGIWQGRVFGGKQQDTPYTSIATSTVWPENNGSNINGGDMSNDFWGNDEEDEEDKNIHVMKTVITYDSSLVTAYSIPENNSFYLSEPLKAAIDEYGDDVRYLVDVKIFKDGKEIYANHKPSEEFTFITDEMLRLVELGYDAYIEEKSNGDEIKYSIAMEVKKEELETFTYNEGYGYIILGWNEEKMSKEKVD